MTGLPLETQGQLAGAVAILSLIVGAAAWEIAKGGLRWVGRSTIAGGVLQLMAFSHHAVSQYEVAIVRANLPTLEVAGGDSGRERTIERINAGGDTVFEREHIAGWQFASAGYRHPAGRQVPQRDESSTGVGEASPGNRRTTEGCPDCILALPGRCGCGGLCCTPRAIHDATGVSTGGVAGVSF